MVGPLAIVALRDLLYKRRVLRWSWGLLERYRWPAVVALVAVLLRTHRMTEVFFSSDAADLAYTVTRHVCGHEGVTAAMSDLTLFRLGAIQPVVVYLHATVAQWLGFNLQAPSWVASSIVVSGAGVWCAALLGQELSDRAGGMWAALVLCVSPIHIMLGRHLGAPWAYEIFFQLLILLLFVQHCRRPNRITLAGLCVALALYVWCGNQMLAIFPVLVCGCWLSYREAEQRGFLAHLRSRFASWWLLVPVASIAWLLEVTFEYREGHLAHALFDKHKELGWYFATWYSDLERDIGYGPTLLGLASVAVAAMSSGRLKGLRGLPVVYFACYTVPFWVWISRRTTLTTAYVVYSITALLLLTALLPFLLSSTGRWRHGVPLITAVLMFVGSISSVYRQAHLQAYLGVRGFQGSYHANNGATTAAAFIREHSGDHRSRVFSDASGGAGLEPPIMKLYFRRPQFSVYDARSPRSVYRKFARRKREIDYVVAEAKNRDLPRRYLGRDFEPLLEVNRGDKSLLYVFARTRGESLTRMSTTAGHEAYGRLYPTLCSR